MIPVSLQIWSLRDDIKTDFAGTVTQVAQMGFDGIELAGTGNLPAAEAFQVLADLGLKVSGMHVGLEAVEKEFDRVVGEAKAAGTGHVIVPWAAADNFPTVEKSIEFGRRLGAIGARFRAQGLQLSYHNHGHEYATLEGRPVMEWIMTGASPEDLLAEVDLYWAQVGGWEPAKAVTRLGTRARLLHLKDGVNGKQTELGRGGIDFASVFDVVEKNDLAEWYVVEQEEYNFAPLESIHKGIEYLRRLGKV